MKPHLSPYTKINSRWLNLLRDYKTRVYPEVQALLERVDTGIYFLTVDDEIYMVRNLLDHDFTPYAMLVLGLEKSEVFQSLYGIANVAITGVSIDGADYVMRRLYKGSSARGCVRGSTGGRRPTVSD